MLCGASPATSRFGNYNLYSEGTTELYLNLKMDQRTKPPAPTFQYTSIEETVRTMGPSSEKGI